MTAKTTIDSVTKIDTGRVLSRGGDGSWKGPGEPGPLPGTLLLKAPQASQTGIWVALAAISLSFAALSSALLVRKSSGDWQHIELPAILYFNTALLLVSSFTLEIARRRIAVFMRKGSGWPSLPLRWLFTTLGLGLVFVAGQIAAWRRLNESGFYLATNPSSSFFYVFTAFHALHVLGGLAALLLVIHRLRPPAPSLRRSTFNAVSCYWHFMGALWLYLLLLLKLQL